MTISMIDAKRLIEHIKLLFGDDIDVWITGLIQIPIYSTVDVDGPYFNSIDITIEDMFDSMGDDDTDIDVESLYISSGGGSDSIDVCLDPDRTMGIIRAFLDNEFDVLQRLLPIDSVR